MSPKISIHYLPKQTGNENIQANQVEAVILIQLYLLTTNLLWDVLWPEGRINHQILGVKWLTSVNFFINFFFDRDMREGEVLQLSRRYPINFFSSGILQNSKLFDTGVMMVITFAYCWHKCSKGALSMYIYCSCLLWHAKQP